MHLCIIILSYIGAIQIASIFEPIHHPRTPLLATFLGPLAVGRVHLEYFTPFSEILFTPLLEHFDALRYVKSVFVSISGM